MTQLLTYILMKDFTGKGQFSLTVSCFVWVLLLLLLVFVCLFIFFFIRKPKPKPFSVTGEDQASFDSSQGNLRGVL